MTESTFTTAHTIRYRYSGPRQSFRFEGKMVSFVDGREYDLGPGSLVASLVRRQLLKPVEPTTAEATTAPASSGATTTPETPSAPDTSSSSAVNDATESNTSSRRRGARSATPTNEQPETTSSSETPES